MQYGYPGFNTPEGLEQFNFERWSMLQGDVYVITLCMFHHIEHSVVSSGRGIDVVLVVVSLVECHDSQCFIGFLHALRSDRGEVFGVVDRWCTSRGGAASLTRMATTIRR